MPLARRRVDSREGERSLLPRANGSPFRERTGRSDPGLELCLPCRSRDLCGTWSPTLSVNRLGEVQRRQVSMFGRAYDPDGASAAPRTCPRALRHGPDRHWMGVYEVRWDGFRCLT